MSCFVPKTFAVKVAVKSCEAVENRWFGSLICREGIPKILDVHLQIALTAEHVAVLIAFRSVSSEDS